MKNEKDRGWFDIAFPAVLFGSLLALGVCVVVPRTGHGNAKKKTAESLIVDFGNAIEMFRSDCGRFPSTAEGVQALMVQPSGAYGWKGPYLENGVPCDPWGHAYVYKCPGEHNKERFDLCSFGPDGQEGGGDDLDNWNHK